MGLARKGSRRITIDGVAYRWTVSADDGYMILAAERADGPGQRLETVFQYDDVYVPDGLGALRIGQRRSIAPGVVREAILYALSLGWRPSTPVAKAFRIQGGASRGTGDRTC